MVDLVRFIHRHIPVIFTVGWNMCITPIGPHLIAGNDGWDVILHQTFKECKVCKIYNEMFDRCMKYCNK